MFGVTSTSAVGNLSSISTGNSDKKSTTPVAQSDKSSDEAGRSGVSLGDLLQNLNQKILQSSNNQLVEGYY